jgi:FlaA1/EpsC-like NDP-sugar epimerase
MFKGKRILITGGAGSLGSALVRRLLTCTGPPDTITILSRDEAKHHAMRLHYQNVQVATDELIYSDFREKVRFQIGDVRDFHSVAQSLRNVDIVFHAAAIKQVPTVEYNPFEAVRTNVGGMENIISAIVEQKLNVEKVIGISTDKACKPINAYGMTKALMERVTIAANLRTGDTDFVLTRYGNVMGSTGSVIPLFLYQKSKGLPLTITHPEMTRFMLNLDRAVDTIFVAATRGCAGEIFVPKIKSAKVIDVANAIADNVKLIGIRPGERIHEPLISTEEWTYVTGFSDYYVVRPQLPELLAGSLNVEMKEYSSANELLTPAEVDILLHQEGYI